MAQWLGQFTGNTHETKVRDIEGSLRIAVDSLKASSSSQFEQRVEAVEHLSERLVAARLKMVRARSKKLRAMKEVDELKLKKLTVQEQQIQAEGISAIFDEFGVSSYFKKSDSRQDG